MTAFRFTRSLYGPYSRMLDMGGMSTNHAPIRRMDASKNCKVRAIAFDFDLLTRSVAKQQQPEPPLQSPTTSTAPLLESSPSPISSALEEIANVLNVNLGGQRTPHKPATEQDDLSILLGDAQTAPEKSTPSETVVPNFSNDVRSKYARKLRDKGMGGLEGVDLAKSEVHEMLQKGDAAGHLLARAALSQQSNTESSTRWMAMTGTGSLLNYISNRSMKIALLPLPTEKEDASQMKQIDKRMRDFSKQLPQVSFDLLLSQGKPAKEMLDRVLEEFDVEPLALMVVSDRDDFLREAKDLEMVACRVQAKNARRGNISAHYTSETVAGVKDVVNEINGISYQAVFASGSP